MDSEKENYNKYDDEDISSVEVAEWALERRLPINYEVIQRFFNVSTEKAKHLIYYMQRSPCVTVNASNPWTKKISGNSQITVLAVNAKKRPKPTLTPEQYRIGALWRLAHGLKVDEKEYKK